MERRRHVELGASEAHELLPQDGSEHQVLIQDDGLRDTVQAHDVGEERLHHGLSRVGMRQWNKMAVLTVTVDNGEDDRFSPDTGQRLNEVHPDVGPNQHRHQEGMEQASWMQVL